MTAYAGREVARPSAASAVAADGLGGGGGVAGRGAADWLSLAAAPSFAIMALLTWIFGGPSAMRCSAGGDASMLGGMLPMYLLMSVFHSVAWLKRGRHRC